MGLCRCAPEVGERKLSEFEPQKVSKLVGARQVLDLLGYVPRKIQGYIDLTAQGPPQVCQLLWKQYSRYAKDPQLLS